MIRHAVAVAVAILLSPSWLYAQTTEFTVKVESATVHKSPSTGSPAIGRAPRGTVLDVTRDIGSWVKIAWPDADDGVGYVHQSKGTIADRSTREQRLAAAFAGAPTTPESTSPGTSGVVPAPNVDQSSMLTGTTYVAPPTHIIGLGGRMGGSTMGDFGVTARVWSRNRFGIQLEASRSAFTSTIAPGRMTSLQFAPSAIYSFRDHVTDNVWIRPYLGTGASIHRSSLRMGPTETSDSVSESSYGVRTFGGAEVTFPSIARFAVSADVGYLWSQAPFPDFELGGLGFTVSGHWYVK